MSWDGAIDHGEQVKGTGPHRSSWQVPERYFIILEYEFNSKVQKIRLEESKNAYYQSKFA